MRVCSLWATLEASVGSWTLWRITPNSSPPRRAAVSPVRMTDSSWFGKRLQGGIAGGMPEPVVDALEVVEIDEQDSRLPAGRLRVATAWSSRSVKWTRFARPVSGS